MSRKYEEAVGVIDKVSHLKVEDSELFKNVGRYVKYIDNDKRGLFAKLGMVYEIVTIQKHWGYINGQYVPHKIGYRLAQIGNPNCFGRVGDVDEVIFVDVTEEDAIKHNDSIMKQVEF